MLDSQARWLRGLDHPERRVRDVALRILTDEKVRDPLVGKAVRSAIDRFGWDEAFEYPSQMFDLPLDAESFEWLLGRLERPDGEPPDLIHRKQILFWLTSVEPALQLPFLDRLQAALRRYLKIGADYTLPEAPPPRTAADIWANIEEACDRLREIDKFPRDALSGIETLSEQLWAAPDVRELAHQFEDWFERDPESDDKLDFWRVGIAVSMMGRLGSLEALPRLLELLEKDFDWYNEQVMKAFIAIGSLECARFLVDAYPDSSEIVRIFLIGALERLRFPEIEPELWKLCESEQDEMNRVQLAFALALYGTPESIHRAAAIAEENLQDPERIDLLELLYAQDVLAGNPPAGRQERWLRIFEEREAEARERMARFENLRRPLPLSAVAPETIFREAPKTGRNDACPCGSGKKYKKCCGKKG